MSKANELINLLLDKYEERLSSLSNRRIMIKKREIDSFDTKLEETVGVNATCSVIKDIHFESELEQAVDVSKLIIE